MDYDTDELYILTIKVKDLNNRHNLNEGNSEGIIYTNICKQNEYYIDVPDHGPYYTGIDIDAVINIISSTVGWYPDKQEYGNQEYGYIIRLYNLTMNEVNNILDDIFNALKEEYQHWHEFDDEY